MTGADLEIFQVGMEVKRIISKTIWLTIRYMFSACVHTKIKQNMKLYHLFLFYCSLFFKIQRGGCATFVSPLLVSATKKKGNLRTLS